MSSLFSSLVHDATSIASSLGVVFWWGSFGLLGGSLGFSDEIGLGKWLAQYLVLLGTSGSKANPRSDQSHPPPMLAERVPRTNRKTDKRRERLTTLRYVCTVA